ncbi:hypothetical protein BBFL7_00611 [Flavobacteria bacterium BBFL7]|nr:hypothetical protein BBFL7_00611 [Flavobacteria bacterium BBFL7]
MKQIFLLLILIINFSCKRETAKPPVAEYNIESKQLNMVNYKDMLENCRYAFEVTVDSSYFYNHRNNGFVYNRHLANSTYKKIDSVLKSVESNIVTQKSFFLNTDISIDNSGVLRGRLHEYTFDNNEIASDSYKQLERIAYEDMNSFEEVFSWDNPSRLILKNNHLYHIVMGGKNMDGIQLELAALLFPENSIP